MSSFCIRLEISPESRGNGQVHGGLRKRGAALLAIALCVLGCSKREPERDTAASARPATAATPDSPAGASAAPRVENGSKAAPEPEAPPKTVPEAPPPAAPEPPEPPSERGTTGTAQTVTDVFDDYGFPAYTGLEHLCGGRDLIGDGEQIAWDVFVSNDAADRIVQAYTRRLGQGGLEKEGAAGRWRLPAGSPTPDRTLLVTTPDRPGKHESCKAKPAATAKSIVVVTRH